MSVIYMCCTFAGGAARLRKMLFLTQVVPPGYSRHIDKGYALTARMTTSVFLTETALLCIAIALTEAERQ